MFRIRAGSLPVAAAAALVATLASTPSAAQNPADRFGIWEMQSDAPPPSSNVMTYEPYGEGGMSITVASVNSRGESNEWGYVTLFDGAFREVWGQTGSDTAVEFIDERSTLSEDGDTIHNEYVRLDAEGKITGVSHAVYVRRH